MSLKEVLKGNVIAMGKSYGKLKGEEIKLLMGLKCLSNQNSYIVGTNKSILIHLLKLDKRTFEKHFKSLIDKDFISVEGDMNKCLIIKISKDDTFELFDVEFILDMIYDLTPAEIKLFCAMSTFINIKVNKNYVYPSMESIAKEYYGDISNEELNAKIKNKGLDKLKNKLIEKGYIKKVVAYYFETHKGELGKTTLGYFLKIGENEVASNEYFGFVEKQMELYNENHKNVMKLASEKYLLKCKYKNIDRYVCYRDVTYNNSSNDEFEYEYYEPRKDYVKPRKKTLLEILKDK